MTDIMLMGSPLNATYAAAGTLVTGKTRAWKYIARYSGYITSIQFQTDTPTNTASVIEVGIAKDNAGTIAAKSILVEKYEGGGGGGIPIPPSTVVVIPLPVPVRIVKGTAYWFQIHASGSLHIKEAVASGGTAVVEATTEGVIGSGVTYAALTSKGPVPFVAMGRLQNGRSGLVLLKDLQMDRELYPLYRWTFNETGPSPTTADGVPTLIDEDTQNVSNVLTSVGRPAMNRPGMNAKDCYMSAMGGYAMAGGFPSEKNYWSIALGAAALIGKDGFTIEAITSAEPNGKTFALVKLASVFEVLVEGSSIKFVVKDTTPKTNTLTAASVLSGRPQLVQCVWRGKLAGEGSMGIWVNGVQVGSLSLGSFKSSVTSSAENMVVCEPASAALTEAVIQDLAIYEKSLTPARLLQHFNAFNQTLSDPGHVRI